VGECFFWYWPTWRVPDKGPLNGCVVYLPVSCTVQQHAAPAGFAVAAFEKIKPRATLLFNPLLIKMDIKLCLCLSVILSTHLHRLVKFVITAAMWRDM